MLIEYLFLKEKDELCSSEKEFVHFLNSKHNHLPFCTYETKAFL